MRFYTPLLTIAAVLLYDYPAPTEAAAAAGAASGAAVTTNKSTTSLPSYCNPATNNNDGDNGDGDIGSSESCTLPPALTLENIARFMDETIPTLMEESHIVGTTLSVVQQAPSSTAEDEDEGKKSINASLGSWLYGQVFGKDDGEFWQYSQGYGMANMEHNIAVDPELTLFRPGSISKTFLWTAVMQLMERRKLDLDTDICTYLDCESIPSLRASNNPKQYPPVTMKHLMTHTPGFEDYLFNLFVRDESKLMTLQESISFQTLKRMRAPGTEVSYSNFGSLLAGRIVEVVSGMSFEEYIEKNIFQRLHMDHSTFRQPLPETLAPHMSEGYAYNGIEMVPKHFEFMQGTPAGGLTSTANDLAKFMKAHLSTNTGGGGLLKPATMQQMHQLLYQPDPHYNMGFTHGLMDMSTHGVRVIGHGGDTFYFHSLMALLPEHKLGIFFSFNTGVENGMPDFPADKLALQFMDHFFPAPTGRDKQAMRKALLSNNNTNDGDNSSSSSTITTATKKLAVDYTGSFNANRRSESDLLKVNSLAMSFQVKPGSTPNSLLISSFLEPEPTEYMEIDRHLFQEADGHQRILFLVDEMDSTDETTTPAVVKSIFISAMPLMQFSKCQWWETKQFNIVLAACGQISLLLGIAVWYLKPVGFWVWSKIQSLRRGRENDSNSTATATGKEDETKTKVTSTTTTTTLEDPKGAQMASRLGSIVVLVYVCFFGSVIYISDDMIFVGVLPKWPFFLPYLGFALGLPLPIMAATAWRKKYWGPIFRTYYTVFAIAVQGLFCFLFQWGFVARKL